MDVEEDKGETEGGKGGRVMGYGRRCKVAFAVTKTEAERSGRVYQRRLQANGTEGRTQMRGYFCTTRTSATLASASLAYFPMKGVPQRAMHLEDRHYVIQCELVKKQYENS